MGNQKGIIEICLATYNGESYIGQFLESLCRQTYKDFRILVSDDGSSDKTLSIIALFYSKLDIRILPGNKKNKGAALNFLYLMSNTKASYILFADQDDVWVKDKVFICLTEMRNQENLVKNKPILVFSDLMIVNSELDLLFLSFFKHQGFCKYINNIGEIIPYQNVVTGCTIMINQQLCSLATCNSNVVLMHDWWIALVAVYSGAQISVINEPLVLYRQHDKNAVGAPNKVNAFIKAFRFVVALKPKIFSLKVQYSMCKNAGYHKGYIYFLVKKIIISIKG